MSHGINLPVAVNGPALRKPLTPGQAIAYPVPGTPATVTVQRTDNGETGQLVFLVYVAQGPHRPDGWSRPYGCETIARFEATRAAKLLHRYGSADAIERRRAELVEVIAEQQRRQPRRMHNPALLAAAEAEADTLLDLHSMAMLADLRAQLAAA